MLSDFQSLLEQMMDDHSLETVYQEQVSQDPQLITDFLIQTISENPNSKLSNFSIILFCRLASVLSENFISIGNEEFHQHIATDLFSFLNNPDFAEYSLSLISDLISRIILNYSYSEEFDTVGLFFPILKEIIQSQNVNNSKAALDTLVYCIYNESIDFQQISDSISGFLETVLTGEEINPEILLSSLKLLYVTFDSISIDFHLPDIFNFLKKDIELLNKSIHDIITYLPLDKYAFFNECPVFFIVYFLEILGTEDMPVDLEYCSLEIIYNFSRSFYNDFSNNCEEALNNIFLFLCNYETESEESKFIISKISEEYGSICTFASHCYSIFLEVLSTDNERFPEKQIAAMKLFSYCYDGMYIHLSVELPNEFLETIVQSGVMDSPNQLVRLTAFEMLSSLFNKLSEESNPFQQMIIYQKMIENIENPDHPIVLASKFKAFKYFLNSFNADDLSTIFNDIKEKILELAGSSAPEQLIYILGCIEVFFSQLQNQNFDKFKEYFLDILKNPTMVPFGIYRMALQSSTYLDEIPDDAFYFAFSYITELDFEKMTEEDLHSLTISIYRICRKYPSYALTLFPLFLKFSITGAMNDVEYSYIPFQELSSMVNVHTVVEKRNNLIKSYDGTQIHLIIFFLKVLRYSLLIKSPSIAEMIQEDAAAIYDILLKWSFINFSDKIQYNALKIVHYFLVLTKYEFPFELLLEQLMNFTLKETKESRLINLYTLIFRIFYDTINYNKMSEQIMTSAVTFYSHELKKELKRRGKMCESITLGDCSINPNSASCLENSLALIWLPFVTTSSIDLSFFSVLVGVSMNNPFVSSFSFIGHYYKYKEQNPEIIEYLINNFIASTDDEEDEKSKNPFYSLDSQYAALFLISFINDKMLDEKEVTFLIEIFNNRTKVMINTSHYISLLILIADKYSDHFDSMQVFSLLEKTKGLYHFDYTKIKMVLEAWNNIFPILCKQLFDAEMLARILGILFYFKEVMPEELAESQKNELLQNYQQDQDELYQLFDDYIHFKFSFQEE